MKKIAKAILVFTIIIAMIIPMAPVQAATSKTISLDKLAKGQNNFYEDPYSVTDEVGYWLRNSWEKGITTVKFTFKKSKVSKATLDKGVTNGIDFWFSPEGRTIKVLSKKYTKTSYTVKIKIQKSELEQLLEKRIKELDLKNKKYSDAEKLILAIDFIWKNAHYAVDPDNAEKNMIKVLKQQDGGLACEQYAKLLNKFCDKLDIKAYYAVNKIRNHAVSAIQLDGVFYMVDITEGGSSGNSKYSIDDKVLVCNVIELGDGYFNKDQVHNGKLATEWTKSLREVNKKYDLGLIDEEEEIPLEEGEYEVEIGIID